MVIKIWDLKSGLCLRTLNGHLSAVTCIEIFSNGLLLSSSKDKTLKHRLIDVLIVQRSKII